MAEFCLDCWNKMNESDDDEKKYIISKDFGLCEGCGQWKHIIIMERTAYYIQRFRYFILPFRIICNILCFIYKLFILPYLIFKYYKSEDEDKL